MEMKNVQANTSEISECLKHSSIGKEVQQKIRKSTKNQSLL